ncbi:hypothetical protein FACS1894156_5100 [Bacteroidia bacterium]|nr:hypothetical protein FACS1894156_5100 [Bacteroidia bacterium]
MCLLVSVNAKAGVNEITVAQKGDFNLGIGIGIPYVKDWNALAPTVSADMSWVLTSGFINTKAFGKNGGVDLGVYYGFSAYRQDLATSAAASHKLFQHSALVRAAFHFQFVEKLDAYAGIMCGTNIRAYSDNTKTDANFAYHLYSGAKYYFLPNFAVKLEFIEDFSPWGMVGIQLKF